MKKISFCDKYGLTEAVLQGRKTMTRRIVGNRMTEDDIRAYLKGYTELANKCAPYKIGEVVAVAQCYEDAILDVGEEKWNKIHKWYNIHYLCHEKGLHNKMLVRADLMPHQIRIADIKVERLQDISYEDCMREGIKKSMWMDVSGKQLYGFGTNEDKWASPRDAFAALIDKVSGKGTWESNPWVFAYSFELVK